jgi:hypothetical protein
VRYSRSSHDGGGGDEFQKHVTSSLNTVHPSIKTPRRSFVHEELAGKGVQAMDREDDFSPVCVMKCATNFAV